ncbi:MAG: biotin--[acetyl-CoA-carboxylase] ligase [Eubacteriales bacterium]|nr:biotin--[acetyl-CoA-carboxylase] ligase [Eubacteriales bacterium]
MSVKSELIRILEENRGHAVSGEALAKALGVSRAAVWKAAAALKEEGHSIISEKKRGYTLTEDSDCMTKEGIRLYLDTAFSDCYVEVLDVIDSTNNYAKRLVADGFFEKKGVKRALIAANEQTAGRGRLGRSFFSPADTGIYMTLILKAGGKMADFLPVTVAAAVAVTRAIEQFTDETPGIKWVNDIWIGDRKVCGILSEGISDFENGTLEAVIVGIGINVDTKASVFPEEVRKVAASLDTVHASRNQIVAAVASELFQLFGELGKPELMDEYRRKSLILGREIYWDDVLGRHTGLAAAINDAGNLEVETGEGRIVLSSGEVSIRPLSMLQKPENGKREDPIAGEKYDGAESKENET